MKKQDIRKPKKLFTRRKDDYNWKEKQKRRDYQVATGETEWRYNFYDNR